MAKQSNWKNYWEPKEQWQYRDEEFDYGWLKRSVAAIVLFAIIYGAHVSETVLATVVDNGIRYLVNTETDFQYITEQALRYAPQDSPVLKRVQSVISKPADPLAYMIAPVKGKIAAPFGWYTHPVLKQEMMHEGIDVEVPLGTNVKAAAAGAVETITDTARNGKTIILNHGQEVRTVYAHLGEILVKQGEAVSAGQVIAKSGKTGITAGPMLYFEIQEKGKAIDPLTRIKGDFSAEGGK